MTDDNNKEAAAAEEPRGAAMAALNSWFLDANSRQKSWKLHERSRREDAVAWGIAGLAGLAAGMFGHLTRGRTFTRYHIEGGSVGTFFGLSGLFALSCQRRAREREILARAHAEAWDVSARRIAWEAARLKAVGNSPPKKEIDASLTAAREWYFSTLSGPAGSP